MNLSNLDLNLLFTLHAVLAERSVARAAARLHVTSPAVSNALARLRDAIGDPLFVRKGRGLTPTPRALELEATLTSTFGALERALTATPFDPKTSERSFSLALSDTPISSRVCPPSPAPSRAIYRAPASRSSASTR